MGRWTVAAGRQIYFDGKPFIHIAKEGDTEPVEADGAAHFIAECLNNAAVTPDDIWERHMGHPRRKPKHARETREAGTDDDRMISSTYGVLPAFNKFLVDIRRPDPEHPGQEYWPPGTTYPMELVSSGEIELADAFGALTPFASRYSHKAGYRGDERTLYNFLAFLVEQFNEGNDEAGDLASSIMYTLGYEWI